MVGINTAKKWNLKEFSFICGDPNDRNEVNEPLTKSRFADMIYTFDDMIWKYHHSCRQLFADVKRSELKRLELYNFAKSSILDVWLTSECTSIQTYVQFY